MSKHMTTHAPIGPGSIYSQWTLVSGGPSTPVKQPPGRRDPAPDPNVLLTARQLTKPDERGRRELVEVRLVLTAATLRPLIDQLEDHASNVEAVPAALPGVIGGDVASDAMEIARARAAVARLNGGTV